MSIKSLVAFGITLLALNANSQPVKKYLDSANMDISIKPGDNFYKYANGKWLEKTSIPPSKTTWGSPYILMEESSKALQNILEKAKDNPTPSILEKTIGDFYASGMDSSNIEAKGYSPILNYLKRIDALQSKADFIKELADARIKGIYNPLFAFYIGQDQKEVTKNVPHFSQAGTTLPDRDYYLKDDARNTNIRKEFLQFISDMFVLIGKDSLEGKNNASIILDIETQLAKAQMSRTDLRDPNKTYNKIHVDDLTKKSTLINWRDMLQRLLITGKDSVIVSNPQFLFTADSLVNIIPLDKWKVYLQWYVLKGNAPYLSSVFVSRNFEFNKVLSGQKVISPRWQRMSGLIDSRLGDMLGQVYVEEYFNEKSKKRMLDLVNNLQAAFENRINKAKWMSDSTKVKAKEKLYAFGKKIGFPDKWKTYDGVVISRDNLIENIRTCAEWGYQESIRKIDSPIDKTEWYFTPPTVNAYYSPLNNEIAFPAGILQFPFFDAGADDAINYGAIGAVIGHEMTHGFDDNGRLYDAQGNLNDWWIEKDATEFTKLADKIVDEFNNYTVVDTMRINGKLTLGENIADFGGLQIAYEAFKRTEQGKSNNKIDGFTPDQRFFLSWAQIWRNKTTPETEMRLLVVDTHSPGEFRCNAALKHMKEFYNAFNVTPKNKMFIKKRERIVIW